MSLDNLRDREGGFTLIELLVVIAIIGILSSVVLASLNSARQSSRDARRQTDLQQISLALELFYDSCGAYPNESDADGDTIVQELTTGASLSSCSTTFEQFMSSMPTDPQDDQEYAYKTNGANSTYCLGTELESGNAPDNNVSSCLSGGGADAELSDTSEDTFNYAVAP